MPATPVNWHGTIPGGGAIVDNTLQVDVDNNYFYAWADYTAFGLGQTTRLLKVAMGSMTIVAQSALTSGNLLDNNPIVPVPSWTGTKLWGELWDSGSSTVKTTSWDKTTLAIVDQWPAPTLPAGSGGLGIPALNSDGTMAAWIVYPNTGDNAIVLMNLATGAYSVVEASTIGGPAPNQNFPYFLPCFDAAGNLWSYDSASNFWKITIISVMGTPIATSVTIINARTNDGASFAQCDFNPTTNIMTAWSGKTSGNDVWVVPINTLTSTVGTIYTLPNGAYAYEGTSSDMQGWENKRYVAVIQQEPFTSAANEVGVFDRQTGITTYYDWMATWGIPVPTGLKITGLTVNSTGTLINAVNDYQTNAPYTAYFWFMPLGSPAIAKTYAEIFN